LPNVAVTSTVPDASLAWLVYELKQLRQGQDITNGPLGARLAPVTRRALGIYDTDDEEAILAKVLSRMQAAAEVLPGDQRAAVVAAFGLSPGYHGRYYKDRVAAFADARQVNPRTVRRWVDRGLDLLARSLLAARAEPECGPGWWTEELKVALVLDQPAPESLEVRRVIAARDGLAELNLATTITGADARTVLERVCFDLFYGGTLRVGPMESSDRIRLVLALPKPLSQGETHEFAVRTRLPADHDMRQHCVCVPNYRCMRFDLWVRFPADYQPRRVGKLVDVYQRDVEDPATTTEDVPTDSAGEVHVRFGELALSRASGLRWQY
jgi:hypothetical protein